MKKTVNVLGTAYKIIVKKYDADEAFERLSVDGLCDGYVKEIVLCEMSTYPGFQHESKALIAKAQNETLRHEIVHAFLNESGLESSSAQYGCGWAKNEEMIDWIALQGPKIYKAWQDAGAL